MWLMYMYVYKYSICSIISFWVSVIKMLLGFNTTNGRTNGGLVDQR